jgi:hypothetical protein
MPWPPWAKHNEKDLARYALKEVANAIRLEPGLGDSLNGPDGRSVVAEAIYQALASRGRKVRYSPPLYNPDQEKQDIRDPDTILEGSGAATCLELALLYAGAALGNGLLPLLVLLKGHALVAVSTTRGWSEATAPIRNTDEGPWVKDGVLRDDARLKELVDRGNYLLIECTGFSVSVSALPPSVPEGLGRVNGVLPFDRAKAAGREQLERSDRPFLFAVDVAFLQKVGLVPFESSGRSLAAVPDLRRRLNGVFESHRVFGGRRKELDQIDAFVSDTPSGYLLVTGPSGCGKSALIANWIRERTERGEAVAYHFISKQHQLAGHDDTFRTLVQQLRYWFGQTVGGHSARAELEAAYLELLEQAPPVPLVVVIEGLDEAYGWTVGPQLFPQSLPHGTHVVLSAREAAPGGWAQKLKLPAPQVIELDALTQEDILDLLHKAGVPDWAKVPEAVAALTAKSQGDPFYVRLLIGDFLPDSLGNAARIRAPEDLAAQPSGLDDYLSLWWTEIQDTIKSDQSVKQLLGYLLVARGGLNREELLGLGPDGVLDWSTVDTALELIQRFLIGDADRGYVLSHWRFQNFLVRKKIPKNSQAPYRKRILEWCTNWQQNKSDYALRHGVDHVLDDGPEGPGGGAKAALELCLSSGGNFVSEAIGTAGLGHVQEQLGRVFAAAVRRRQWEEAAAAFLVLRHLRSLGRPFTRALALLFGSDPGVIPERVGELEQIADHTSRLALAVLAAARWQDAGELAVVEALRGWIAQQPEVAQNAGNAPAAEALEAIFRVAPTELVERLVDLPLFAEERQRWMVLISLWSRSRKEQHRAAVLRLLDGSPESASPGASSAVEYLVTAAAGARDSEMLLAACRWLGRCSEPVQVENCGLGTIGERLPADAPRAIQLLSANRRLKDHVSLRADVCALLLDDSPAETEFALFAAELATAAGVDLDDVRRQLTEYTARWGDVWALSPAQLREWLAVRLAFILPGFVDPDDRRQALLRKLTVSLCTVLRWVAAQQPAEPGHQAAIEKCLADVSVLAWRRPAPSSPRFIEQESQAWPLTDEIDPLRASTCLRTANWLAGNDCLPSRRRFLAGDIDAEANREVLRLVFTLDGPGLDELNASFTVAWGRPPLNSDRSALESPWLSAWRAVAKAAGVRWEASWEKDLGSEYLAERLPERLRAYARQVQNRVLEVNEEHGWHPALLDVGLGLWPLVPERHLKAEEKLYRAMVSPALAEMDSGVLARCPNTLAWPPTFYPAAFAARVPRPVAGALAALELNDRGWLWGVCRDLCLRKDDSGWWESVRSFRDELRRRVLTSPPHLLWYKKDEPAEQLLEATLAPINLLLDDPPRKEDFEAIAGESSRPRLRACIAAKPEPALLRWTVEKLRASRPETWLLEALLQTRSWDLLALLLEGPKEDGAPDLLRGFNVDEVAVEYADYQEWSNLLAKAVGMGAVEGIIYRIPHLAQQVVAGRPFDDPLILQHCKAVRLSTGWRDTVRDALQSKHARISEIVRTLLVVTLFTGDAAPALLAAEIESEREGTERGDLEPEFLWVGKAAAPVLLTPERVEAVARSKKGIDVLVALGAWDAVRLHLSAHAVEKDEAAQDDLIGWYRAPTGFFSSPVNATFGPDQQLACLRIYLELVPSLLTERRKPPEQVEELAPVREVSRKLKFEGHNLTEIVAAAARAGQAELSESWMKAILFEAANGRDRQADLDCLNTVCSCAGAWLTVERDTTMCSLWMEFIADVSKEFGTRELWLALFRGAALVRGRGLLDEVQSWFLPDDLPVQLALAEVFTQHGQPTEVRTLWEELLRRNGWGGYICLRVCDALQGRGQVPEFAAMAREFVALAWRQARALTEVREEKLIAEFLADVVERAVRTRTEEVLESIGTAVQNDESRAAALGRIALDVFLEQLRTRNSGGNHWKLADLQGQSLAWALTTLIEEAVRGSGPAELGEYNHTWSESTAAIASGLGWLEALLKAVLDVEPDSGLLAWLGTWICRIHADRDTHGAVGRVILEWAARADAVSPESAPLLDFAISSILERRWELSEQLKLIRGLLKAAYRTDDCLRMLDKNLSFQPDYRVWGLTEAAVVCGETTTDPRIAERYLQQLPSEDRALAEDRIAEKRGKPTANRLDRLLSAPQTNAVIKQIIRVVSGAVGQLRTLNDEDLHAISAVVPRLLPDSPRLDERLASALSESLPSNSVVRLRSTAALLDGISQETIEYGIAG